MGSASELEYQVLLCRDLTYFNQEQYALLEERTKEVKRMIASFAHKLNVSRGRKQPQPETDKLTD